MPSQATIKPFEAPHKRPSAPCRGGSGRAGSSEQQARDRVCGFCFGCMRVYRDGVLSDLFRVCKGQKVFS